MAKNDSLPLPSTRAVAPDAARTRGTGPTRREMSAAAVRGATGVGLPHDPALERLRRRKAQRKAMNVHVEGAVLDAFSAFVDAEDFPKGETVSLALQEFLERRGIMIPGLAPVLPAPDPAPDGAE